MQAILYSFLEWSTVFYYVRRRLFLLRYLYLIHETSHSLDVFKAVKVKVENQLQKKIKAVKSDRVGEYYDGYDE